MDLPKPARSLIESAIYTENKKKISSDDKLLDEVTNAVTYAIACDPTQFPLVDEKDSIRIAQTREFNDFPPLTIYFKEENEDIILLDLEITPDNDSAIF